MQTFELRASQDSASDVGHTAPGETWIDIDLTDADGRRWLTDESGLDRMVVDRLLEPPTATYWRRFGAGRHLHMRAPVPGEEPAVVAMLEFGIWLEPSRIITVRVGRVPAFEHVAEAIARGEGPDSCFALIMLVLAEGMMRLEDNLHELVATIDELEDEVLAEEMEPPIHRLGDLQKRLIYARRFRMPLANMLSFVATQPDSVLGDSVRDELEGLINVIHQHQELVNLSIERASALQGQIRDQMADAMNTATFRFTWVATVFLPLSFLTGLLGINVAGIPGDHNPEAFWLFCGALTIIAAIWGIAVSRVTSPFRRRPRPHVHRSRSQGTARS